MQCLKKQFRISFILLAFILLYTACPKLTLKMQEKLVWKSPEMKFLVINQTSSDIFLVPIDTVRFNGQYLTPGDTANVVFHAAIYEITDKLDKSGQKQMIKHYRLLATESTPFLFESGDDYALQIELEGERYQFLIQKVDGWFKDPPIQERLIIKVSGPPVTGMFAN